MKIQEIIAGNIRAAREQAGLTQAQLAEKLGLASHSAMSDIEASRRRVSATELAEIGRLTGKSIDWFFDPAAAQEDFVVLARAEGQSDGVKAALREIQRLLEHYLLLKSLLKGTQRG